MIIKIGRITRNIIAGFILTAIAAVIILLIWSNKNRIDTNKYDKPLNRVAYINLQGWDVDETPYSVEEIVIPTNFNSVYQNYNNVMRKQGWDLSDYKGKNATEYIYKIKNYGGKKGSDNVYARVIILDQRIIGGDIFLMETNGFIKPIRG